MFNELVSQYYEQCLNSETSRSISYSETYNESGNIYYETPDYSESCTPEDLCGDW